VPPSAATINVEEQKNDPESLFAWYQSLIRLKKTVPAFENGANIMLDTENHKVLSWMRQAHGAAQVVVSVNFTAVPQTVNLSIGGAGVGPRHVKTLLKSPGAAEPANLGAIELGPYGVYIGEIH
jgi:glycosidase